MKVIKERFEEYFAAWEIRLPVEDVSDRRRGKMVKAGWAIWYLFGSDENGEYLDFYASHRMTNDRHLRIYQDGQEEDLPAIRDMRMASEDPVEDQKLEAEFQAENERVAKMLDEKGFGITGDEPGGVQMNRFLRVHGLE